MISPSPERKRDRRASDARYERKRAADPRLANAKRIRSSGAWATFRADYRKRHPYCADPTRRHVGQQIPTEDVHHIQPLTERPDLAFTESNVIALCVGCHNEVEFAERRGHHNVRLLFAEHVERVKARESRLFD